MISLVATSHLRGRNLCNGSRRDMAHIPNISTPPKMAMKAPISVLMKLTTSFVMNSNPSFSWSVAPIKLSAFVARKAAMVDTMTPGQLIKWMAYPKSDSSRPPTTAAAVPSAETAPSVPGLTRSNVVIRNVVFPYAFPISLANVSASLVARDATYANKYTSDDMPRKDPPPCTEHAAQIKPVSADPHTFSGPRRPPRASAIPAFSFS
mmetsp:Transcript_2/g.3  ORF Transcript_2/g.3 Transcript_2/m.3 type:complete len:207 (-) Transcript_2:530-1150(-)